MGKMRIFFCQVFTLFYVVNGSVDLLSADRILCPVLAALVNASLLVPDVNGSVTLEQIQSALVDGLWDDKDNGEFQAVGISDYSREYKETQTHRDRCFPGITACGRQKWKDGNVTEETERWLNIYKMNGLQAVNHGFSTGTRGGANNVPDFSLCGGIYPCEDRFQSYYLDCADDNGRYYQANLECTLCKAWTEGDRDGEFSYNPLQSNQQWQAVAATFGWMNAFTRVDEGDERGLLTSYFTTDDLRAMIMEGRFPDDWVRREWGSMEDFPEAAVYNLPCQDPDTNKNPEWWSNTTCPAFTGDTCTFSCNGGASCLDGRCVCGMGTNAISMCWSETDQQCNEREDECMYFGEPCYRIAADNPSAPW